ncbi:MAG: CBS domain-containing protein [Ectothiorhodospiraceae bacterium]|nr:CBS domain-containing protein [Ectothiorhodospiraceae bacterium]MCH8502830.1 CBS domain-containing protein [Ectothiorhodospiraceae bacterium]
MRSLLVKDVMARHPPAIRLGTDLREVVNTLLGHHLTGLPVTDEADHVVGFVSEQDCLRALLVSSYHAEGDPKVEDVMHHPPLTVALDDSVVDVAEQMLTQKPKIYPVLDDNRRLAGMLTRNQVLRAVKNRLLLTV